MKCMIEYFLYITLITKNKKNKNKRKNKKNTKAFRVGMAHKNFLSKS